MPALVTGATGFVGANLVRELLADGFAVRVLVRPSSPLTALRGLDVEKVPGDLEDVASLEKALAGCDALFHTAAHYSLWERDPAIFERVNIQGTRILLAAAGRAGIRKIVYTSSVAAVGFRKDGRPADETIVMDEKDLVSPYKWSKYRAEQVALELARNGLPVVVVNPSAPIGPWDVKPTPTGRIIVDFLNGKMPAYLDTGLNLIHVRDVARGHILALRKGKPGERYVLANTNMTLKTILELLAGIAGRPAPKFRIPFALARVAAACDTFVEGTLLGRTPRIPVDAVKMARHFMYFDATKAIRDLGLPQTPVRTALEDAVRWFRDNGHVKS
ncbi:MAG: hopanoid-associated sugar epimerase [Planctomycetota bacterium]